MARIALLAAAGSLAVASAFTASAHAGLALRSHQAADSLTSMRRTIRGQPARIAPNMQVEQLAEHATLLAAYPEGLVNGMTSYFNLCESLWHRVCACARFFGIPALIMICLRPLICDSPHHENPVPSIMDVFIRFCTKSMSDGVTMACMHCDKSHACMNSLKNINTVAPIFKTLNFPPFLLHWFHALNMGIVLFAMGGYGTFLGWNMRYAD